MKKISTTQAALTTIYIAALMVANTVTSKLVQLPFGVTMTAGLVVFPLTYILSDVFSEVYGYRWSRITCYASFAVNVGMIALYQAAAALPYPPYYIDQAAFYSVLGNTPKVVFASMLAFIVGDFLNDRVFQKLKESREGMGGFGVRAIASSLVGELCDSAVFIPIVFFGEMPVEAMFAMAATEAAVKVAYEIVILPLTTLITRKVLEYEQG